MKKAIILLLLFGACTPFLSSNQLDDHVNFDMTFIPEKAYLQINSQGEKKTGKNLLKDDLYVVISESEQKIYIYPFYKSSPYIGGMGFNIKTTSKDASGYVASISDEYGERIGYAIIQNKKYLDLIIRLEKKTEKYTTLLGITADCNKTTEIKEITFSDSVLLSSF